MYMRTFFLIFLSLVVNSEPREGVDYSVIPEGIVKLEGVTEIFWYGCPACAAYEEVLKKIKERNPDAQVNKIPLYTEPTAKTFYTIEALKLGDEAHAKVFEDWQLKRRSFRTENDLKAFSKRHGYDEDKFIKTFNSFGIQMKARNAINIPRKLVNAGVDFTGVPTVVVNGVYLVNRQRDTSKEIETILYLLDR